MAELADLLAVLRFEAVGEHSYLARSVSLTGGSVVFGGQLLAQAIVAGGLVDPAKDVKSIHTVFAKGAAFDQPLESDADGTATGRAIASSSVTIRQGERVCTRSLVLLSAAEPDLIRHQDEAPDVTGPDELPGAAHGGDMWDIRTVGGVDISDPDAVGPAELQVWTRFPDAPDDPTISRALLAFASDGFLIGAAMRPHEGVGQSMAHVSISTTVVTHTLSFHEPFRASEWMLLDQSSPYAGRGRSYGRADVYAADGRYVASFAQENMIRDFPEGQRPAAGTKSAH